MPTMRPPPTAIDDKTMHSLAPLASQCKPPLFVVVPQYHTLSWTCELVLPLIEAASFGKAQGR